MLFKTFVSNSKKSSSPKQKNEQNKQYKRLINTLRSIPREAKVKNMMKNYHDYSGINNLFEYLKQIYPEPNLSPEERGFIARWAENSNRLNKYFDADDVNAKEIKILNSIINKYPNIKGNVMLHRYTHDDFFLVDVGDNGVFNRFIATSFSSTKTKQHGEYYTIILTPKGTNGAFIEETLRKYDGDTHLMEELLMHDIEYDTLYMNYITKTAVIQIK